MKKVFDFYSLLILLSILHEKKINTKTKAKNKINIILLTKIKRCLLSWLLDNFH